MLLSLEGQGYSLLGRPSPQDASRSVLCCICLCHDVLPHPRIISTSIPPPLPLPTTSCTTRSSPILPVPPAEIPPTLFLPPLQLLDTIPPLPLFIPLLALPTDLQVHPVLTLSPIGTEPGKVEFTDLPPHVPVATPRALLTEAPVVLLAQRQPRLLLDVQIQTLVPVLAVAILIVELTLAHLPQVVLVEIVARIALLAQRLEPVLADVVVIVAVVVVARRRGLRGRWVAVGTPSSERAVAGGVGGADLGRADEGVAGGAEEGREGEGGWGAGRRGGKDGGCGDGAGAGRLCRGGSHFVCELGAQILSDNP